MFTTLNPPEEDEVNDSIEWAERIEQALQGRGVRTVFQPIVDLVANRVCGYEALTRFDGPLTGKRVGPEHWFQAAHELGAGGELEAVCLSSALKHRESLPHGCYMSVNIDPDSLESSRVQAVLAAQPDLNAVVIELTEHQVWTWHQIESAVSALRARGARIAIDNTGTGTSGLRQLVDCRPGLLKIDRQLIDNIDQDEAKLALVEMMVTFGRRIGAELVAEGVETVAEALTLKELDVPQAQGYLFGRPTAGWSEIEEDDIACLLRSDKSPSQAVPRQVVSGQETPSQDTRGHDTPSQAVPGQGVPRQAVPRQAVPGQGAPGQGTPRQAVPGQGVPRQAVPGQGTPGQDRGQRPGPNGSPATQGRRQTGPVAAPPSPTAVDPFQQSSTPKPGR